MTTSERRRLALRDAISDLSEEFYCAGWLVDCEYSLWGMVAARRRGEPGPFPWGLGAVPAGSIDDLGELSAACGGWFYWDDAAMCEKFVPMKDWLEMYERFEEMLIGGPT